MKLSLPSEFIFSCCRGSESDTNFVIGFFGPRSMRFPAGDSMRINNFPPFPPDNKWLGRAVKDLSVDLFIWTLSAISGALYRSPESLLKPRFFFSPVSTRAAYKASLRGCLPHHFDFYLSWLTITRLVSREFIASRATSALFTHSFFIGSMQQPRKPL